jgi:hypothetical protein
MTDEPTLDHLSRRGLLAAFGAAAAAGAAIALPGTVSASGLPITEVARPETFATPTTGLAYLPIDGLAFDVYNTASFPSYNDNDGVYFNNTNAVANLTLPEGSIVKQIDVGYRGTTSVQVFQRNLALSNGKTPAGATVTKLIDKTLATVPAYDSVTVDLSSSPITIAHDSTYFIQFAASAQFNLFGVTIGYTPATQSFVPFGGAIPRLYDSRLSGGILNAGEDRSINVGAAGFRSAVFNLAVDATTAGTTGPGFVGAYSAAKSTWPNNASINWDHKGALLSNTVICAVDSSGTIKLHGGVSPVHVVIDMIGFLV